MKKIALNGMIILRREESETVKNMQFESDKIQKGYSGYEKRFEQNRERLTEIRSKLTPLMEKLETAIKETEGRAKVRKINAEDILNAVLQVDDYFGITKKAMIGTTIKVDCNAQKFPNAYKWVPESTCFCAEMTSIGWAVTSIFRDTTKSKKFYVELSDTAKEAYMEKAIHLGE